MGTVPTVEIFRDGERLIVNASDLPQWKAQGWGEQVIVPPAEPEKEPPIVMPEAKAKKK